MMLMKALRFGRPLNRLLMVTAASRRLTRWKFEMGYFLFQAISGFLISRTSLRHTGLSACSAKRTALKARRLSANWSTQFATMRISTLSSSIRAQTLVRLIEQFCWTAIFLSCRWLMIYFLFARFELLVDHCSTGYR